MMLFISATCLLIINKWAIISPFFFLSFIKAYAWFVSPQLSKFSLFVSLSSFWCPCFFPYLFHSHLGFFHPRPSSCLGPSPTLPFPAVGSQPALLQLPRQPVSFSPKLLANRVEQPGPGDQEEGKPLSGQSALRVCSPGPHALPQGLGRGEQCWSCRWEAPSHFW